MRVTRQLAVVLADGTRVGLRPLIPADRVLLEVGLASLSEESRRLRFLVPTDKLTPGQWAYLTEIDFVDHVAWGALEGRRPVGVARFIRTEDLVAEVAVTVVDDMQRRGLGRLLIEVLAVVARSVGLETFEFILLAENQAMLGLLSRWDPAIVHEEGVVRATVAVASITNRDLDGHAILEMTSARRRSTSL